MYNIFIDRIGEESKIQVWGEIEGMNFFYNNGPNLFALYQKMVLTIKIPNSQMKEAYCTALLKKLFKNIMMFDNNNI